jgi:hypothetical protein
MVFASNFVIVQPKLSAKYDALEACSEHSKVMKHTNNNMEA